MAGAAWAATRHRRPAAAGSCARRCPRRPARARTTRAAATTQAVAELASAADYAWNVGGGKLAGVEGTLFQASLVPYLVFLGFLGKAEDAPPVTNAGARFLLLFVAATIPAGIVAKAQYGEILANVDVLHGSSESLLTVSNFLLALGLARACAEARKQPGVPNGARTTAGALAAFAGLCTVGAGAVALGADAALPQALADEPANALSMPTWTVHVSSVTEWAVAMRLAWQYGALTGNRAWQGFAVSMAPSLAGALTACTFHLWYNAPPLFPLVPLQALLTFVGNTTTAVGAYRVWRGGEQAVEGASPIDEAPYDEARAIAKLAAWSVGAAAAIKYGSIALGDTFAEAPADLTTPLAVIVLPTLAYTASLNGESTGKTLSMDRVKERPDERHTERFCGAAHAADLHYCTHTLSAFAGVWNRRHAQLRARRACVLGVGASLCPIVVSRCGGQLA